MAIAAPDDIKQMLVEHSWPATSALPQEDRVRRQDVGALLNMLVEGGGFKDYTPARDIEQLRGVAGRYDRPGMEDTLAHILKLLDLRQRPSYPYGGRRQ